MRLFISHLKLNVVQQSDGETIRIDLFEWVRNSLQARFTSFRTKMEIEKQ